MSKPGRNSIESSPGPNFSQLLNASIATLHYTLQSCANWAVQVVKHVGQPAPFAHDDEVVTDNTRVQLSSPSSASSMVAEIMRSGRACMLRLGLRPPKGPT